MIFEFPRSGREVMNASEKARKSRPLPSRQTCTSSCQGRMNPVRTKSVLHPPVLDCGHMQREGGKGGLACGTVADHRQGFNMTRLFTDANNFVIILNIIAV